MTSHEGVHGVSSSLDRSTRCSCRLRPAPVLVGFVMPRAGWKKLSAETRLAKMWYIEGHIEPSEIADRLKRDKSAIAQLLATQTPRLQ